MSVAGSEIVRASAGTGKTYYLVETYVSQVLAQGLRPSQIVAITFTRKAAAELRARIRARLRNAGVDASTLADLSQAPIGNFHGLALNLLRRFGASTSPGASTLSVLGSEGDDRLLFVTACEEAWFGQGSAVAEAVRAVAPHFAVATDLPLALFEGLSRAREDGRIIAAEELLARADVQGFRARSEARLRILCESLRSARGELSGDNLAKVEAFLAAVPHAGLAGVEWAEAWARAGEKISRRGKLGAFIDKATCAFLQKELLPTFKAEACWEQVRAALVALVDAAWAHYGELKLERRALDFGDLVETVVQRLEADASTHAQLVERYRCILVDEAQDTNRLQRHFVHLLANLRGPMHGKKPAATLIAVGDRKQAIYTFRGADPESFQVFAEDVHRVGGSERQLSSSWRSTPELCAGINHLGERLFPGAYESLEPAMREGGPVVEALGRPAMQWIELASNGENAFAAAQREASVMARFVAGRVLLGESPSDFTVLLSAMSRARLFAEALARQGIPAVLGGGGGLYAQPEVQDVAALCAWLVDEEDRLAAAIALRSPIGGLSDGALLSLLGRGNGGDALLLLRRGLLELPSHCDADDARALRRLAVALPKLVAASQLMTPAELLRYVESLLHLDAAYLGLALGEQKVANLARLGEIATTMSASGRGGLARFARELASRIEAGHSEAEPPVGAGGRGAVSILTVHQAKGLEFPVVLLCDLSHGKGRDFGPARFTRDHGLVVRPSVDGRATAPEAWREAEASSKQVAADELARLLYVAVTRARKEAIFFAPAKARATGFLTLLAPWRDEAQRDGVLLLQQGEAGAADSPAGDSTSELCASPTVHGQGGAHEERVPLLETLPPAPGSRLVLPVTELEGFLQCGRRGILLHRLPLAREPDARFAASGERSRLHPLERGRLAHAVLAGLAGQGRISSVAEFVSGELARLGHDPQDPGLRPIVEDLEHFLASPFGQELIASDPAQRRHELPFALAVESSSYVAVLRGQMDLLFWDEHGPVVVDFKHSMRDARALAGYRVQLEAYGAATAALCGVASDAPVRTRLVFLAERRAPLDHLVSGEMRESLLSATRDVLQQIAASEADATKWPVSPEARCAELACEFRTICREPAGVVT